MNDHDALLRAICEFPFDTTPRLVYADYLDDRQATLICPKCKGTGNRKPKRMKSGERTRRRRDVKTYVESCRLCHRSRAVQTDADRAAFIRANMETETNFYQQTDGELPPFEFDWPTGVVDDEFVIEMASRWQWIGAGGFVSTIQVTRIEDIFGGTCYRCDGAGVTAWDNADDGNTCLGCGGAKRLPDRSALWLRHPITEVRLFGLDAYSLAHPDRPGPVRPLRGWFFDYGGMWSCNLPVELHAHWPAGGIWTADLRTVAYEGVGDTPTRRSEDADSKADLALSRAVVNMARHRAGLTRLAWPDEPGDDQAEVNESPNSEIPKIFS